MVWKLQFRTELHEGGLDQSTQIPVRAASQTLRAVPGWLQLLDHHRDTSYSSVNLEAQTFLHWPCLHFVSLSRYLSSNHFGSLSFLLLKCWLQTPLSEAVACCLILQYLLWGQSLKEFTAFLVARSEGPYLFNKRKWGWREGKKGGSSWMWGWCPTITNFILSTPHFKGHLYIHL